MCSLCLKAKPAAWPLPRLPYPFTDFMAAEMFFLSPRSRGERALALTPNWILAGGVLSVAGSRERVYLFVP